MQQEKKGYDWKKGPGMGSSTSEKGIQIKSYCTFQEDILVIVKSVKGPVIAGKK